MRVLQDDARTSNRDLAAAVHVSPSTSSERVRALRADGVIRGYHADIDFGALGRHVQALTAITIRPPTREIIEALTRGAETADVDHDGRVSLHELRDQVSRAVAQRTGNQQNPTIDRDNLLQKVTLPIFAPR